MMGMTFPASPSVWRLTDAAFSMIAILEQPGSGARSP
jgi:hypothetical protein